jgi:hypothetical protein
MIFGTELDGPATRNTGRESTQHMGYLTTWAAWGLLSRAQILRKDRRFVPIKLPGDPPSDWSIFFRALSSCALLRFSFASDLISMASTCSQPIAHSYPHASIVESGFQFSKPPLSSDARCSAVPLASTCLRWTCRRR